MRSDTRWRREGADGRPELDSIELVNAAQWVNARAGERRMGRRDWTVTDQSTTDELEARSWCFGELQSLALWSTPSWFTLLELPSWRAGFERFLGFVVRAYRIGAVGVLLSYEEAMALCDVRSRATWRKWCVELERRGLVRIIQTWRIDERGRCVHARLHYRIGPELEALGGVALLEGAEVDGSPRQSWAKRIAVGLRTRAREARRETKATRWKQCREGLQLGACQSAVTPVQTDNAGVVDDAAATGELAHEQQPSPATQTDTTTCRSSGHSEPASSCAELDDVGPSSGGGAPRDDVAGELDDASTGAAAGAQRAHNQQRPSTRRAGVPAQVGSSVSALHSAPVPGADTRAPRRPRKDASASRCAPAAAPVLASSSSPATSSRGAPPPELGPTSSSSAQREHVHTLQASDEVAPRPPSSSSGVELLRTWLDAHSDASNHTRSRARRDALDELRRSLDAAAPPRCSTCGGAGGAYTKTSDVVDGPSWAPERRVAFDGWVVCDDCDGSGEGP